MLFFGYMNDNEEFIKVIFLINVLFKFYLLLDIFLENFINNINEIYV